MKTDQVVIVAIQSKITNQWSYCPILAVPILGRVLEYDDKPSGFTTAEAALAAARRDPTVPPGSTFEVYSLHRAIAAQITSPAAAALLDPAVDDWTNLSHTYTSEELQREARALCKGLGRFVGWEIQLISAGRSPGDLEASSTRLIAKFVRRYNSLRPLASQAIERVTMVL